MFSDGSKIQKSSFLTENERQEVYEGLIVQAARLSMQPSESLWSVDEEGTANARADDEGMASKEDEDAVDEGEQFMEGESSQGQRPPPRNPRPSCPLAALLGERYGGGAARPKTNTQEDEAKEQMTRYKEADLLEVEEDPLVWWKEHQYQYPLLSQLAKSQLASSSGPVLTAPCSTLPPLLASPHSSAPSFQHVPTFCSLASTSSQPLSLTFSLYSQ
ncbi:uncharacterized protein LOC120551494 [Perca fluviatilis]|uniref:uncharacterized protein LOC120551494 n=1 Tax=Perca fluviatilis TaxID=8168 RepID=UPI00196586B1|nr:uncharacterized protein LOC120551494 [Perca fluviatilis]